ncbi:MAG: hypothetical protein HDR22_10445 [Lachnospiraceae bacterium]|nr:hypothetical protein [Lachnospiraceae bacterium]
MKKLALSAMIAATIMTTAGSTLLVQASAGNSVCQKLQKNGYVIVGGKVSSKSELNEILSKLEKELKNGKWNCIPETELPEDCKPETSKPETDKPETNKPETNKPETDKPETNKPETNKPETNKPETNKPETDKPETNKPENGTEAPNQSEEDSAEASFAEQVVKLVNEERAKAGLNPVSLDKEIEAAALIRAKEIQSSFSHTRPNGSSFSTVLKEQGIRYSGAGENIAWGQISPEAVMEAWMNSDGHRANILNPKFTKLGVGYDQSAKGRNYWVQLFTY